LPFAQEKETMKRVTLAILTLCVLTTASWATVTRFRSGIFLHHSTGGCIWGPNGSSTSVPQEMQLYNQVHGFTGDQAVTMNEQWFPGSTDNEWSTWHTVFEHDQPEAISGYYAGNRIIMVKSCFPSSALEGVGQPSDTTQPWMKTIFNYKWHWRHLAGVMRAHPQNFFVIWTNAPLEHQSTDSTAARLSDRFCTWAADTLQAGLDPVMGVFPRNVYVFDFFHKLTDPAGFMLDQYRAGPGDSHPNAAATALVAPQFVRETFDQSILYEAYVNDPSAGPEPGPFDRHDRSLVVSPSPSAGPVTFYYVADEAGPASIRVYSAGGRLLRTLTPRPGTGVQAIEWNGRDECGREVPTGVLLCRYVAGHTAGRSTADGTVAGRAAATTRLVRIR
jgi:hypothetical protein